MGTRDVKKGLAYCEAQCARVLRALCNETAFSLLPNNLRFLRKAYRAELTAHLSGCSSRIVIQALHGSRSVASLQVVVSEVDHDSSLQNLQPLSMNLSVLLLK